MAKLEDAKVGQIVLITGEACRMCGNIGQISGKEACLHKRNRESGGLDIMHIKPEHRHLEKFLREEMHINANSMGGECCIECIGGV